MSVTQRRLIALCVRTNRALSVGRPMWKGAVSVSLPMSRAPQMQLFRCFSKKNNSQRQQGKPKNQVTVQVCAENGETDDKIATFNASATDIESIRNMTLKKSGLDPNDDDSLVQYYNKEEGMWEDLEMADEIDNKKPLFTRVAAEEEYDEENFSDDDHGQFNDDDMYGHNNRDKMKDALKDLVTEKDSEKMLNAQPNEVRTFILEAANELDTVQDAIISTPQGLDHLTNCLQYPFVHRMFGETGSEPDSSEE